MPGVRCYTRRNRGAPATSARLGFESQQFGPSQQVRLYPIPAAAETGRRGKIPPTTRTVDLLLTCNDHGDAPLHAAAHEGGGYLSQIQWKILTDELLLVRNDDDVTPRRTAVRRGFI